jgi:hypothetical protein
MLYEHTNFLSNRQRLRFQAIQITKEPIESRKIVTFPLQKRNIGWLSPHEGISATGGGEGNRVITPAIEWATAKFVFLIFNTDFQSQWFVILLSIH